MSPNTVSLTMWNTINKLPPVGEPVLCLSNGSADIDNFVIDRTHVVDNGAIDFINNYSHNYSKWMLLQDLLKDVFLTELKTAQRIYDKWTSYKTYNNDLLAQSFPRWIEQNIHDIEEKEKPNGQK